MADDPTLARTTQEPQRYADYLALHLVLDAQPSPTSLRHHDEMLFVISHQVVELLLKLTLHELLQAGSRLASNDPAGSLTALIRVHAVQDAMADQWEVLDTLTPEAFERFRHALGTASGFQSVQYRAVEFMLGCKRRSLTRACANTVDDREKLLEALRAPSLYEEFIRYLGRRGFGIPVDTRHNVLDPDVPRQPLVRALELVYAEADTETRELCDAMVTISEKFRHWRRRHVDVAARLIGSAPGTAGTSGVSYLRQGLTTSVFPELVTARAKSRQKLNERE